MVIGVLCGDNIEVWYASPDVNVLVEDTFLGVDRGEVRVYDINDYSWSFLDVMGKIEEMRRQDGREVCETLGS